MLAYTPAVHMKVPKPQETVRIVGVLADIRTVHMKDPKPQVASVRIVGVLADMPTVHLPDTKPEKASVTTVGCRPTCLQCTSRIQICFTLDLYFDEYVCRIHLFSFFYRALAHFRANVSPVLLFQSFLFVAAALKQYRLRHLHDPN